MNPYDEYVASYLAARARWLSERPDLKLIGPWETLLRSTKRFAEACALVNAEFARAGARMADLVAAVHASGGAKVW